MPVRIMCSISFSADDEPGSKDMFDDRYKRTRKGGGGAGDSQDYLNGGSQLDGYGEDGVGGDGGEEDEADGGVDGLAAFFDGCSLHGANHVFAEDQTFSVRQGLWGLVFTLALSAFVMQVVDRVTTYLQYDHITMLDERTADNMTFPAVTFCNYNTFRRSQISYSDLIFMGPLLGFEDNMAPGIPLAPDRPPGSRFSLDEFHNRTRFRIEEMLLECDFRGQECGPENFLEVGVCVWGGGGERGGGGGSIGNHSSVSRR
ncbi:hypothetical protein NHX12_031005 [Muraenolepis orangiensis]|uniref:Acid-sensing ion channel 1 n=1 Tax=Muraenolepis orangiensis TaxID=630683 RepID=A0A9Q0EBC3_9TELE|nr:hypothetical protein NHX12_031005 [Muraenolepis orangiensis]